MKKQFFLLLVLFIIFITLQGQAINGHMSRVIDGDTYVITTLDSTYKVRLAGIDCPEHNQPFGTEATFFVNQFIDSEVILSISGTDRYNRTLGEVFINEIRLSKEILLSGLGWHYKKYSDEAELIETEELARESKNGLWIQESPIAPWDWRRLSFSQKVEFFEVSSTLAPIDLDYVTDLTSSIDEGFQSETVYVCGGKYATKYHKHKSCHGLNNCKGEISSTTKSTASGNGKTACKICY